MTDTGFLNIANLENGWVLIGEMRGTSQETACDSKRPVLPFTPTRVLRRGGSSTGLRAAVSMHCPWQPPAHLTTERWK